MSDPVTDELNRLTRAEVIRQRDDALQAHAREKQRADEALSEQRRLIACYEAEHACLMKSEESRRAALARAERLEKTIAALRTALSREKQRADELTERIESGFMKGAYARLSELQEIERKYVGGQLKDALKQRDGEGRNG